jgi:hypothetical protein
MSSSDLAAITGLPQKERLPAYLSLLPTLYASPLPGLPALIAHIVQDPAVPLLIGRQVLAQLVEDLVKGRLEAAKGKADETEIQREVLEKTLAAVGTHSGNYDEQVRADPTVLLSPTPGWRR